MPEFVRTFADAIRDIDARSVLDIALIAVIIFALLSLLRGTTAMALLRGGATVFVAAYVLANYFNLTALRWLLDRLATGLVVAVFVVFQPEIRRTLERVGRTRVTGLRTRPAMDALVDAVARGCRDLSRRRFGALIVIERDTGLEDYIATGTRIDAMPTEELLSNLFYRNSPLHDGAVIVRGDRIHAAACTLPLTEAPMDGHLGTRHKAGIGISERTDAVAVIVSEETGSISVASNGRLVTKLDEAGLRMLLTGLLAREDRSVGKLRRATEAMLVGRPADGDAISGEVAR